MTAEEKLKEWRDGSYRIPDFIDKKGRAWGCSRDNVVLITPEHIDLIANLVVERLKEKG